MAAMSDDPSNGPARPHRPVRVPATAFEGIEGGLDPAVELRIAHDSARALVHRVRESDDPDLVERMVAYTDEHGLDTLAELWARASARCCCFAFSTPV